MCVCVCVFCVVLCVVAWRSVSPRLRLMANQKTCVTSSSSTWPSSSTKRFSPSLSLPLSLPPSLPLLSLFITVAVFLCDWFLVQFLTAKAARTAIIISREEQNAGNYRNARDVLLGMYRREYHLTQIYITCFTCVRGN